MAHEIAKLLLEHAETFLERTEAIRAALSLGMPLDEIEEYLDWLDAVRGKPRDDTSDRFMPAAPLAPTPGSVEPPGQAAGPPAAAASQPPAPEGAASEEGPKAAQPPAPATSRPAADVHGASESQPPSASGTPPEGSA